MRRFIAKILYLLLFFKIKKESKRVDSAIAIYGHDQKRKPFEELIKWLIKNDYHFITPKELLMYIEGKKLPHAKNIWLSFDDGWLSNFTDILPILEKYQIPATIFIATKGISDGYYWFDRAFQNRDSSLYHRVDDLWLMPNKNRVSIIEQLPAYHGKRKTMNQDEIKAMTASGLISWGNHTHDHVMSDNCTNEELCHEIDLCNYTIETITGKKCDFIYSFPNGNYDERSVNLIKQKGFKMAATVELGRVIPYSDPYRIKRNEFKNGCLQENIMQILGIWTPLFSFIKKSLRIKDYK